MSFHGQRLKQLRARAGLDPLPSGIYMSGFVPGFVESIDPRFYSPATRYWYDKVCEHVESAGVIPASERDAFKLVGLVLRMCRDERDERKRREFLMPSAQAQRDFDAARYHQAAELMKQRLLIAEMRRRGYRYGPDHELPDEVKVPSADGLFDRSMAAEYGQTEGAIKQKRLRWRTAYERAVRADV